MYVCHVCMCVALGWEGRRWDQNACPELFHHLSLVVEKMLAGMGPVTFGLVVSGIVRNITRCYRLSLSFCCVSAGFPFRSEVA